MPRLPRVSSGPRGLDLPLASRNRSPAVTSGCCTHLCRKGVAEGVAKVLSQVCTGNVKSTVVSCCMTFANKASGLKTRSPQYKSGAAEKCTGRKLTLCCEVSLQWT